MNCKFNFFVQCVAILQSTLYHRTANMEGRLIVAALKEFRLKRYFDII